MVYIVTRTIHAQTGICPILVSESETIPEELQTKPYSCWGPYELDSEMSNNMIWLRICEKVSSFALDSIDFIREHINYIGGEKPEPIEGMKIMGPFLIFTKSI